MAKVNIKSEKNTPFGGIFHVRELFSRFVGPVIDKVLGLRCISYGYQYSEIVDSLSSVYFCGGYCVEDVTSHLMPHLSLHPIMRTCSSDTILRGISELATADTVYTSDTGKSYDFNTATKLNRLLVKVLMNTGQLVAGESYDLDFDHQFIETEKYEHTDQLEGKTPPKSVKSPDEKLLANIMKAINDHLDDDSLTMELIASEVGLSRVHLNRKMKDLTGQTPHDFIRKVRLKKAAELLASGKMNVSEVTYTCGFSSPTSFSALFKKFYGVSPSQYYKSKTE